MSRWCDGGRPQRSRLGSLRNRAVNTAKRRRAEATLSHVRIGQEPPEDVLSFVHLGSRLQGDGDDEADVLHRMDIAQSAFGSLGHLWETLVSLYRRS